MSREIFNHINLNQISHTSFNDEIFDQTNYNQISHETSNLEIFNQTNLNHIKQSKYIILLNITQLKVLEVFDLTWSD